VYFCTIANNAETIYATFLKFAKLEYCGRSFRCAWREEEEEVEVH